MSQRADRPVDWLTYRFLIVDAHRVTDSQPVKHALAAENFAAPMLRLLSQVPQVGQVVDRFLSIRGARGRFG